MLPYKEDKEEFDNSSNLQSVLCKVPRSVYFSSLNIGQWRKTFEIYYISKPQLQIGFKQFWKIVFEFVLMRMSQNYAQFCDKSNTFVIVTIKTITW